LKGEPYCLGADKKGGCIDLQFYGYLGEPNLELPLEQLKEGNLLLEYNPKIGEWIKREWIEAEPEKQENLPKEEVNDQLD
jgi:hypothetical protein